MSLEHSAKHYSIDESRMIDSVLALPEHMKEAWQLSESFASGIPGNSQDLIICGMGGSSIGGRLLKDLIPRERGASVYLERGYTLPYLAGTDTPVICISYSGNTEEVLSAFDEACERGCPVSVITSGGTLLDKADSRGVPVLKVPGGLPPRAAIGYLFTPLLRIASERGIYRLEGSQFEKVMRFAAKLLKRAGPGSDLAENSALLLAKRLYGKIPLIYSGDGLLAGTAYRWKCQFNENSKVMAFSNNFPELGHNEVMGWDSPEKLRQDIFLIVLRDMDDHPRVQKRIDATFELLEPLAGGAVMLESEGGDGPGGRLSRLISMLVMADLTSVYLAVEYGRDPTPIGKIEQIKKKLRSED